MLHYVKKYELTNQKMTLKKGLVLHRIRVLRDFACIKKGDLGGLVESEANLATDYNLAWVAGEAKVYGNARVIGDAWASGSAQVFDKAAVSGRAVVNGKARIFGEAMVYGDALVFGNAEICGMAFGVSFELAWCDLLAEIRGKKISKECRNQYRQAIRFAKSFFS